MSLSPATLAAGALSFTVAIAWNTAVSQTIDSIFRPKNEAAAARVTILYAMFVTLFVIVIAAVYNRASRLAGVVAATAAPSKIEPAVGAHSSLTHPRGIHAHR